MARPNLDKFSTPASCSMFVYKYPPKGINVNQLAIKLNFLLKISTNWHSNYLLVLRFHSYSVSRPSYIHIYACPTDYVGAHAEFVRAHPCINDGVGMVLRLMYRLVQKKCPLLEFLSTLLPTNPGQPVHSQLAPREPPSPNLNPFILLDSVVKGVARNLSCRSEPKANNNTGPKIILCNRFGDICYCCS